MTQHHHHREARTRRLFRLAGRVRLHRHLPAALRVLHLHGRRTSSSAGEANLEAFFTWHPWLYLFLVPAVGHAACGREERRLGHDRAAAHHADHALAGDRREIPRLVGGGRRSRWCSPSRSWITVNYLGHPGQRRDLRRLRRQLPDGGRVSRDQRMTSAMTRNQVVSFIVSVVLCALPHPRGLSAGDQSARASGRSPWLVDGVAAFSVMTHFESIQKGVLDSRDVLFFLSVIVFSLFTTSVIIRAHRAG